MVETGSLATLATCHGMDNAGFAHRTRWIAAYGHHPGGDHMLCLSREQNERVVIDGGRIIVTILRMAGGRVQLGFEAAREVQIDRGEVHERKQAESIRHRERTGKKTA